MNRIAVIISIMLMLATLTASCVSPQAKPSPQIPAQPAPLQLPQPSAPSNPGQSAGTSQPAAVQELQLQILEPNDESIVKTATITLRGTVTADADITVNGISIAVDNRAFSETIELEEGPNSIDITATDSRGRKVSRELTILYIP